MKRTVTFSALSILTLFLLTSCARTAQFRPVDAPPSVPSQLAGTEYELTPRGENVGDVKVWSEGATTKSAHDDQRVVHVGLRIRNDDDTPLRFEPSRTSIALLNEDGELFEIERPSTVEGDLVVHPGEIGRVDVEFPLPSGVGVYEVAGFEFNWAVVTNETVATNSTTFVREGDRGDRLQYGVGARVYDPYWGYPYYYPPYRL